MSSAISDGSNARWIGYWWSLMQPFVTVLSVVSCGSIVALLAASAACGLRRWHLAAKVSGAVVLAGPVLLLVSMLAFMVLPLAGPGRSDPLVKATVLSEGLSQVMNTGGLACAAALPGAFVWDIARGRRRGAAKKAGG